MTVRTKLTLFFVGFLAAVVGVGMGLNALFLLRYYEVEQRSAFAATAARIAETYAADPAGVLDLMDEIDRQDGIGVTLADADFAIVASSFHLKSGADLDTLANGIRSLLTEKPAPKPGTDYYRSLSDPDGGAPRLVYVLRLADGSYLILQRALKGVQDSVAVANRFYLWTGLALLLAGGAVVLVAAQRAARPIREMSEAAEGMSRLDFSRRVGTDRKDEIGALGRSVDRLSERLSASLDQLRGDVERRKELVRNISHELKTPIGVIKGYAEGLRHGVADGDEAKAHRYCDVISEECDRMDGMVRELLALSTLESDGLAMRRGRFDLAETVRRAGERLAPAMEEKGVAFAVEAEGPVPVVADEEWVERAAANYLTNAMNHAEGEKRVVARVAALPGGGAALTVHNTGAPIPEEELERIWDVFHKVDRARSRAYGGHGLGLSIVRLVAERHGGRCAAENADGGVRFTLELP
jgi:two-component system, OmpR family, sensor histidine kinase VanS